MVDHDRPWSTTVDMFSDVFHNLFYDLFSILFYDLFSDLFENLDLLCYGKVLLAWGRSK